MRALLTALLLVAIPAVAADEPEENDCGSGRDAPHGPSNSVVLTFPIDCEATFSSRDALVDERDSYFFEVPPGQSVEVVVEVDDPSLQASVVLYSPNHGPGMTGQLKSVGRDRVAATSNEPGFWHLFLWVCDRPSCGPLRASGYHIRGELSGMEHRTQDAEGTVQVGLPGGSRVNRILGPSEHDGLDGDWVDLAQEASTGTEFLRLRWSGCNACLEPEFGLADGRVVTGACGRLSDTVDCRVPLGAQRVLVSAKGGMDLAYQLRYWHPA